MIRYLDSHRGLSIKLIIHFPLNIGSPSKDKDDVDWAPSLFGKKIRKPLPRRVIQPVQVQVTQPVHESVNPSENQHPEKTESFDPTNEMISDLIDDGHDLPNVVVANEAEKIKIEQLKLQLNDAVNEIKNLSTKSKMQEKEIEKLKTEIKLLRNKIFNFEFVKNKNLINFYTGI